MAPLPGVFQATVTYLDVVGDALEVDRDTIFGETIVEEVTIFDQIAMGTAEVVLGAIAGPLGGCLPGGC